MYSEIIPNLKKEIAQIKSPSDLKILWNKYLGKGGLIKELLAGLKKLDPTAKKQQGPIIQSLYKEALDIFESKQKQTDQAGFEKSLAKDQEELSLISPKIGHLHPMTQTIREMNKLFTSLGYSIFDGPEIETDEYCFQRLNVPTDHPARDMQDTIYIAQPNFLLRTQVSATEARILKNYKPPLKVVCPGRVYRNEKVNKSNHFIFHHYQGLVVMEKVSLKDLFGTFNFLFKKLYGDDVIIRFRNKYYPEVEPGVGPDMQCFNCHGKGCAVCKGVGWIEMGGAGIIHPNVLAMAGIDKNKWQGFAFGLGLDRWVMAKYNITDIRTLLGGNLGYKYYENENTL